jgi:hypothetical protein
MVFKVKEISLNDSYNIKYTGKPVGKNTILLALANHSPANSFVHLSVARLLIESIQENITSQTARMG